MSKHIRTAVLTNTTAQYGGQPGNYPQTGSPGGFAGSPMGYNAPPQSGGGYGRGQGGPNGGQWTQPPAGQNFNNGFGGYQS